MRHRASIFRAASITAALVAIVALVAVAPARAEERKESHLVITTLSTAPDRVSGGDVLVRINVPHTASLDEVTVELNGQDVTDVFLPIGGGHALIGLVSGLRDGDNVLTAWVKRGNPSLFSRLARRNFPIIGPIFAGPHQVPWICETVASGLGEPIDEHCSVATRVEYFYRSTGTPPAFKPLLDPSTRPADLAQTTTIDGHTVDYIVRVESGTIDQSIYRIAILEDPAAPVSQPWSRGGQRPGPGWNGKLNYRFGGGCGPAFRQGRNTPSAVLLHDALSMGYAIALGTRNTLGTGCDDVLSAETLMMVKEHFIEQYGLPKYTVGLGGSGGAIQQHLIGQNYPGLLDALIPGISYPDVVTIIPDVLDCGLLNNYFDNITNPANWPGTRRSKVDGYAVDTMGRTTCRGWSGFANNWQNPFTGFDPVVPVELRYDPVTNPTGARGTFWDGLVNVFGVDPHTGFAPSALDNVGVQYGLKALNDGNITKEEFLDLNEKIGGYDIDGHIVPTRSEGDLKAIEIAYRTGRVVSGENLTLPIIDDRTYRDPFNDIHTRERTFSFLERLKETNGHTSNQVTWTRPLSSDSTLFNQRALAAHDEWQRNLAADTSDDPYPVKVVRAKPGWLVDACWDAAGVKFEEAATYNGPGICNTLYPSHANPRLVAGAPLANDVLKCKLKPIDYADYRVTFAPEEKARLKAIFPHGVCDYSTRGTKQRPLAGAWLEYGP